MGHTILLPATGKMGLANNTASFLVVPNGMVQFKMVKKESRSTVISARTRGIDDIKLHKSTITHPRIVIKFYVFDVSAAVGNAIAPV